MNTPLRWADQVVRDLSACRREELALERDRAQIDQATANNHLRADDNRRVHAALTAELAAIIEEGAHA